jgi:molybdopterin molybdotransferase
MAAAPALTVEEATARICGDAQPLEPETVPITAVHGRVLAEPLRASLTAPPFDASAMDGYAVRAADFAQLPVTLQVVGMAQAGRGFDGAIGPGQAVRIFTGAPVPDGADSVIIQEDTAASGTSVTVTAWDGPRGNVRTRGFDFERGAALLEAGRRFGARELTLAAAAGHGTLSVRRKPVVAILATGDELVTPGTTPGRDQIVCSNTYGLAAMVAAAGGEPRLLGIAKDTIESHNAHFDQAGGADILVTVGGASVGEHDLVQRVLFARGLDLSFWKLAMRPGKPLMYGRLGSTRVLGLPGNPVSALICGRLFLIPLIKRLLGDTSPAFEMETATLGAAIEANGPRQHYMRARLARDANEGLLATPVRSQDSSLLSPLAEAGCLIIRAIDAPKAEPGDTTWILRLDF